MRALAIAAVVAAGGCGRFGFDASEGSQLDDGALEPDAATQYDAMPDALVLPASRCGPVPIGGFTTGTVAGQGGFLAGPMFDEEIVDGGARQGSRSWRISNQIVTGGFSEMPMTEQLAVNAGESTVRSAQGGDSMEWVVWIRTANTVADGSAITLNMSPPGGDRYTYLRIANDLDAKGGVWLRVADYPTSMSRTQTIATQLPRATWIELRASFRAVEGAGNDVFTIDRDGTNIGSYTSWEGYFRAVPPMPPVNRIMIRLAEAPSQIDAAFPDAGAQGFLIDDLCTRIFNSATPDVTIAAYATSFEP